MKPLTTDQKRLLIDLLSDAVLISKARTTGASLKRKGLALYNFNEVVLTDEGRAEALRLKAKLDEKNAAPKI